MRRYHRKNKKNKIIIICCISLLFLITAGYAAFNTNLKITTKGNIKNLKEEVDNKVPTDELLFWGQADNEENTTSILKDKSNNNDGTMYNFDNTSSSGYTDDGLLFDGIDDYVDLGLANYDFKNSLSYVIYINIISTDASYKKIICNQENAGSAIEIYNQNLYFNLWDGTQYTNVNTTFNTNQFYAISTTYDGTAMKLYFDGKLIKEKNISQVTVSPVSLLIGANPQATGQVINNTNMNLKEVMIYDRALTEDEITTITEGLEKKYQ